jgi:hypothetical protein
MEGAWFLLLSLSVFVVLSAGGIAEQFDAAAEDVTDLDDTEQHRTQDDQLLPGGLEQTGAGDVVDNKLPDTLVNIHHDTQKGIQDIKITVDVIEHRPSSVPVNPAGHSDKTVAVPLSPPSNPRVDSGQPGLVDRHDTSQQSDGTEDQASPVSGEQKTEGDESVAQPELNVAHQSDVPQQPNDTELAGAVQQQQARESTDEQQHEHADKSQEKAAQPGRNEPQEHISEPASAETSAHEQSSKLGEFDDEQPELSIKPVKEGQKPFSPTHYDTVIKPHQQEQKPQSTTQGTSPEAAGKPQSTPHEPADKPQEAAGKPQEQKPQSTTPEPASVPAGKLQEQKPQSQPLKLLLNKSREQTLNLGNKAQVQAAQPAVTSQKHVGEHHDEDKATSSKEMESPPSSTAADDALKLGSDADGNDSDNATDSLELLHEQTETAKDDGSKEMPDTEAHDTSQQAVPSETSESPEDTLHSENTLHSETSGETQDEMLSTGTGDSCQAGDSHDETLHVESQTDGKSVS